MEQKDEKLIHEICQPTRRLNHRASLLGNRDLIKLI